MNRPDTESLTDGVTGYDSLSVPPEVKPVVKTTPQEAMALRKAGEFGEDKALWKASQHVAYIIDKMAVHDIICGATVQDSVNIAKKWLKAGGDSESELLGYPLRDGLDKESTIDVAVAKDGKIITDLPQMRKLVSSGKLAWAAEGNPQNAMSQASKISNSLNKSSIPIPK